MSVIKLRQKARYAIADKMSEPLKEFHPLYYADYKKWTLKAIEYIKRMHATVKENSVFINNDLKLNQNQIEAINNCHVVWFKSLPPNEKIHRAYTSYITVLANSHSKQSEYSSEEIQIIYLLSELLLFHFEKTLHMISNYSAFNKLDELEKNGVITSKEAKTLKIEILKEEILPILKLRIKDQEVIDSIMELVTSPERGNKLLAYLRYESNVTSLDLYRAIK